MRNFDGRVAVVTGAASGMGRAFAERFAREGMRVVLADIEEDALEATVQQFKQQEFHAIGVVTDVAKAESVEALAQRALDEYGAVHIVCNNAGVAAGGARPDGQPVPLWEQPLSDWEQPLSDWEWTLNVNLWGVVHGIRTFMPIMIDQDDEGHIVNTASTAGLTTGPGLAIYGVTKHSVVRMTEALYYQLAALDSKVKASVLCPGGVRTRPLPGATAPTSYSRARRGLTPMRSMSAPSRGRSASARRAWTRRRLPSGSSTPSATSSSTSSRTTAWTRASASAWRTSWRVATRSLGRSATWSALVVSARPDPAG